MLNKFIKNIKNKITGNVEEDIEPPVPYVYKKKKEEPVWDTVVHLDDDTVVQQPVEQSPSTDIEFAETEKSDDEQASQPDEESRVLTPATRTLIEPSKEEKPKPVSKKTAKPPKKETPEPSSEKSTKTSEEEKPEPAPKKTTKAPRKGKTVPVPEETVTVSEEEEPVPSADKPAKTSEAEKSKSVSQESAQITEEDSPAKSPEEEPTKPVSKKPARAKKEEKPKPASQKTDETSDKGKAEPVSKQKWALSQFEVEPAQGKTRFHDLDLAAELMHAIHDLGFEYCTPIQAEILPHALEGTDCSGRAQTGTGKTAAFLITILSHLKKNPIDGKRPNGTPRALVMVPTRELALQVQKDANALAKYSQCKVVAVFGGMDYRKQQQMLSQKVVDIVAATPGRLLDFLDKGDIHMDGVEILVIDEADQMLDMGFIPDMRQIIKATPPKTKRQTLFFGATLTPEVNKLASQWTNKPVTVNIEPDQVAVDSVDQLVYLITSKERFSLLYNLITQQNLERVIVFCNRRDTTRKLADRLKSYDINCAILSGDIDQKKRVKTLESFRSGKIRVLVATDVAGRGIHVDDISHVVNYNLPQDAEDYVHRIGRTGRAGASGISISFATEDESFNIPAIEEFLGNKLNCTYPPDELLEKLPPVTAKAERQSDSSESKPRSSQPRRRRPAPRKRKDSPSSGK